MHPVGSGDLKILFPKVDIFDLGEVLAYPAIQPLIDRFDHIGAVRDHFDIAGLFEELESFDDTPQLHTVVGGLRLAATVLLAVSVVLQDAAVASGAWIAQTGAVRVESDLFSGLLLQYVPLLSLS